MRKGGSHLVVEGARRATHVDDDLLYRRRRVSQLADLGRVCSRPERKVGDLLANMADRVTRSCWRA